MTLEDVRDYFQSLGPWWSAATAATYIHVSTRELREMVERLDVLAVVFSDGEPYFPAWQFDEGGVVTGLPRVLAILRPALVAPETCTAWFIAPAYEGEDLRHIDNLREGRLEETIESARCDAGRILGLLHP